MCHRRVGHPLLGYLKRLFPSLNNCNATLDCEACVLAKSHKHTYFSSLIHSIKPFLIYFDVWDPSFHGLIHQTTYPNTPQQNEVAVWENRILLEITRALVFEAYVLAHFWPEAVATTTYLTNRLPTKLSTSKLPW